MKISPCSRQGVNRRSTAAPWRKINPNAASPIFFVPLRLKRILIPKNIHLWKFSWFYWFISEMSKNHPKFISRKKKLFQTKKILLETNDISFMLLESCKFNGAKTFIRRRTIDTKLIWWKFVFAWHFFDTWHRGQFSSCLIRRWEH